MTSVEKIEVNVSNEGHITNSYIVYDDTKKAILIDPGDESKKIISAIDRLNITVEYIVITHAHGDHIGALQSIYEYTNAKILVHEQDEKILFDMENNYSDILNVDLQNIPQDSILKVVDGYLLQVGKMNFEIIHTPGHTAGCICILEEKSNLLFTGDTLFSDCYGRCDLYSGDFNVMVDSLKKLFNRFSDIMIYPGHGEIVNIKESRKYISMLLTLKGVKL